ncbi:Cation/calcium exchanger 1 [Apostasia shenzhenica]|uniref:Cation/calcium exchanger 1 n=1 Tax=Apostasia shenzhenica TaxID=1088818 RepID=A0A2I0BE68_9ASPA|nr:Cation/calcium exchanger 1 [Apostasia shenzhenica]
MASSSIAKSLKSFIKSTFLLLLCFFLTSLIRGPSTSFSLSSTHSHIAGAGCFGLHKLNDPHSKCVFLKSHHPCITQGYVNYLHLFYCVCGRYPALGYLLLSSWLLVLFYLLGNTASQYFCSSVESLSRILQLSPAIAGVTLLSLGNGSPDVFASIVSFRSGSGEVGLSSVLGGAFFVSCIVVGVINISGSSSAAATTAARIDRASFLRDVCFFIFVLSSLLAILIAGRVTIFAAMAFTSLYFVYVSIVSATHFCREKYEGLGLVVPILEAEELNDPISAKEHSSGEAKENSSGEATDHHHHYHHWMSWIVFFIELPLYLPRRLTIPDVSDEKWSRPFAVASAALSPVFLATLWNSKRTGGMSSKEALTIFLYSGLVGLVLGLMALHTTMKDNPPRKCLLPWLAGGFLMSVLWTYIVAEELVGLLVSLGFIFGISPGILGFTVLAWGNSIGDLIANVALAVNGGQDGAQIAISGCYAGPIFNTLAGLGLSLAVSAWAAHPEPFEVPAAPAMFEIVGFMIGGLLWALVILPRKEMKLDRVLGIGLLAIYFCFFSFSLSQTLGFFHF